MSATDEQSAMVAGFAGGMGLSGNACGALSAAIWMKTLRGIQSDPKYKTYPNPEAKELLEIFYKETDYEILCSDITGQNFKTIDEHTEYIENGGCEKLINVLAES